MIKHMVVSIQGALNASQDRSEHKYLKALFGVKSVPVLREILKKELDKGFEVIPGADCDNYDKTGRCLGHPSPFGIKRVTKEVHDQHLRDHMNDPKVHPVRGLMIGNGRFYLTDIKLEHQFTDETFKKFVTEWQNSNGEELPSFPLEVQ